MLRGSPRHLRFAKRQRITIHEQELQGVQDNDMPRSISRKQQLESCNEGISDRTGLQADVVDGGCNVTEKEYQDKVSRKGEWREVI